VLCKKVLSATPRYATQCEIHVKNFLPIPHYAVQRGVDSALCSLAQSYYCKYLCEFPTTCKNGSNYQSVTQVELITTGTVVEGNQSCFNACLSSFAALFCSQNLTRRGGILFIKNAFKNELFFKKWRLVPNVFFSCQHLYLMSLQRSIQKIFCVSGDVLEEVI
jgi:hypothetical protein